MKKKTKIINLDEDEKLRRAAMLHMIEEEKVVKNLKNKNNGKSSEDRTK